MEERGGRREEARRRRWQNIFSPLILVAPSEPSRVSAAVGRCALSIFCGVGGNLTLHKTVKYARVREGTNADPGNRMSYFRPPFLLFFVASKRVSPPPNTQGTFLIRQSALPLLLFFPVSSFFRFFILLWVGDTSPSFSSSDQTAEKVALSKNERRPFLPLLFVIFPNGEM